MLKYNIIEIDYNDKTYQLKVLIFIGKMVLCNQLVKTNQNHSMWNFFMHPQENGTWGCDFQTSRYHKNYIHNAFGAFIGNSERPYSV